MYFILLRSNISIIVHLGFNITGSMQSTEKFISPLILSDKQAAVISVNKKTKSKNIFKQVTIMPCRLKMAEGTLALKMRLNSNHLQVSLTITSSWKLWSPLPDARSQVGSLETFPYRTWKTCNSLIFSNHWMLALPRRP